MSDMNAQVTITLVNRVTAAANQIKSALQGIKQASESLNRAGRNNWRENALRKEEVMARKLRMEYTKLGGVMGKIKGYGKSLMTGGLMGTGSMLMAKGALAVGAMNQIMGPAIEMERFRMQLEALEGSSAKGKEALQWITDFATRTPLELPQVISAYTRMKAMGLDPTNGSLLSLVDTMAFSGKGMENLDSIILGVGQAWTKQKLQGDDARQLLEAGVPVWDILAKKMGKTEEQVLKLSAAGKLGRKEIQMLLDGMAERAKGASDRLSKAWEGITSNVSDAWYQFRSAIADSGPFQLLKNNLNMVLDEVKRMQANGQLKELAENIGGKLTGVLQKVMEMAWGVYRALTAAATIIDRVANAVGGYENLTYMAIGLMMIGKAMGLIIAVGQAASILTTIGLITGGGGVMALAVALIAAAGAAYYFRDAIGGMAGVSGDTAFAALYPMLSLFTILPRKAAEMGARLRAALGTIDFSGMAASAGKMVTTLASGIWSGMGKIATVQAKVVSSLTSGISSAMGKVSGFLAQFGSRIKSSVTSGLGSLYSQGSEFMSTLASGLQSGAANIRSWAASFGAGLPGAISSGLGSLYDVGARWIASLLDGIMAGVGNIVSYVAGIGAQVRAAIGGIGGGGGGGGRTPAGTGFAGRGGARPAGGGKTSSGPSYGGPRAHGGSIHAGLVHKVAERGGELVTPSRHAAVTPLSKLNLGRQATINLGGITINGNADRGTIDHLVAQLERRIQGALHDGAYAT